LAIHSPVEEGHGKRKRGDDDGGSASRGDAAAAMEVETYAGATMLPSLPDDVLACIFRQIGNPKTLAVLSSCVCKTWRHSLAASGAWSMLCAEAGRTPRRPRKPWRELYLDNLRRRREQVDGDHELLMLRATMDPRKAKGNEDVGAMRRDRPRRLRKMLAALGRELDVNYRSVTYGRRSMLGVAARLGSLGCAKELLRAPWCAATNVADVEGWTPLMEAAFRGNEGMAAALLAAGARDEGFEGSRDFGKGQVVGPHTASAWAEYRGNHRIKSMITGEPSTRTSTQPLVKVNSTPFSI